MTTTTTTISEVTAEATVARVPGAGFVPAPRASEEVAESGLAGAVRAAITAVSGHDASVLVPSARLTEDLGFDSVMAMSLADALQPLVGGRGQIDIAELLPQLTTVEQLIIHVKGVVATPVREGAVR